ncbi:NAD(P)H-dependent oxidoreductase [Chitinophaga sp.]|uniref:NADPH-dependent FMN reductase n=1 Tax=Chitinophaga sp. TaxID=1869181 RepID=UPI0031D5D6F5
MSKIIGVIAGSLRKESFSKKIANGLLSMAPEGVEFKIIPIDELPIYNQDFDDHHNVPAAYVTFRNAIQSLHGVIFVTPEHNRSIPAVLKNALDVGSRPYGKSVWNGKPAAVFSNSPGNIGGFGANHHLRQCLVFLNIPVMQQPEVYIQKSHELFDDAGNLKEGERKEFIAKAVGAYIDWANKNA